jgi:hypothetical protein
MADRIQARAIKRCGDLLKEIESQQGGDRKSKDGRPPFGQTQAASDAGMSRRQQKTAIRISAIPERQFE